MDSAPNKDHPDEPDRGTATRVPRDLASAGYLPWPESPIWALQRSYYTSAGAEAWRTNEVPHRITSHRPLAHAYAQCIAAAYQDHRRVAGPVAAAPPTIVEIGAGHGQLTFHLMGELARLVAAGSLPAAVRYVMTDLSEANLEAWRANPRLGPWLEAGRLEMARFDAEADDALHPIGGRPIERDALAGPVVVIANYLFDVLRQDMLRVVEGGRLERGLVQVRRASGEVLERYDRDEGEVDLQLAYAFVPVQEPLYEEPGWDAVVRASAAQSGPRTLLVPTAALSLLERASRWSRAGALFLCADRGSDRLADLPERVPGFGQHGGSFSLPVNFDVLGRVLARRGALVRQHRGELLHLFAAATPPLSGDARCTALAIDTFLDRLDPTAVHLAAKALASGEEPSAGRLLAALRLSGWDAQLLSQLYAFLAPRLGHLPWAERVDWRAALRAVFAAHFPLSRPDMLPQQLGVLASALGVYGDALRYFAAAAAATREGEPVDASMLHAVGVCQLRRGAIEEAERALAAADRAGAAGAAELADAARRWRRERASAAWLAELDPPSGSEPLGWIHAERVAEAIREAPSGWMAERLFDGKPPAHEALLEACGTALANVEGLVAHLDPDLGLVAVSEREGDALRRRWALPGLHQSP